jgi:hypothetical protein
VGAVVGEVVVRQAGDVTSAEDHQFGHISGCAR